MPLRFNGQDPADGGSFLFAILLAVSLVCFIVYNAEGEGGPLHGVQSAAGVLTSPIRTAGAGIQSVETAAQTSLSDLSANPTTVSELKQQNEELRQMVAELEEYRLEAERLQGIQKLSETYGIEGISCRIIGVAGESWNRVLTIDKGSNDGVEIGAPVMGSSGLIGQVKSTTGNTADVRLLQDAASGAAVMIQSNRAEGLLKGNIDGLLYLEDVDADVDVEVGDIVLTSGLGGGYYRGIIVGQVVRVENGNGQSVRKIVVAPNDTVSGLEEVMVVTSVDSKKAVAAASAKAKEDDKSKGSSSSSSTQKAGEGDDGEASDEVEAEEADAAEAEGAEDEELDEDDVIIEEDEDGEE